MNEINYAFWMIIMIFVVIPVYLVGAFIMVEDESKRKKTLILGGVLGSLFFSFLVFKQMNIEVIYAKELLEYWKFMDTEFE